MFEKAVRLLVLFNISVVLCYFQAPRNCTLDFNDGKDEMVVKWSMRNNNHTVESFNVTLVNYSWNNNYETWTCFTVKDIVLDYEYRIPVKYLPETTFKGQVLSCREDCNNCKLASDPCIIVVPPNNPDISAAKIENCDNDVCNFHALITNSTTNSRLYVLDKQNAKQLNFTNSDEAIDFLNKSSILVVNITNNTLIYFDIVLSKHCDEEIVLVAVNFFKSFFSLSDVKHFTIPACYTLYTALVVLVIISLIIAVLIGLLVYCKCRSRNNEPVHTVEMTPLSGTHSYMFFKRLNGHKHHHEGVTKK